MASFHCASPGCTAGALVYYGYCKSRGEHFCRDHASRVEAHSYLGEDPFRLEFATLRRKVRGHDASDEHTTSADIQLAHLRASIDIDGIIAQAKALRPGHTCTAPNPREEPSTIIMGGTNIHVPLTWDDGEKWLARIRQNIYYPYPLDALRMHAASEAATCRALRDAGVNLPETHLPGRDDKSTLVGMRKHKAHSRPGPGLLLHRLHPGQLALLHQ